MSPETIESIRRVSWSVLRKYLRDRRAVRAIGPLMAYQAMIRVLDSVCETLSEYNPLVQRLRAMTGRAVGIVPSGARWAALRYPFSSDLIRNPRRDILRVRTTLTDW